MPTDVYLYDAVRTPFGKYGGALAGVRPDDLAAYVVRTLVDRAPALERGRVDEIVIGNANGAGEDNRNVARMAGLPTSVPATTVNRRRAVGTQGREVDVVGGLEKLPDVIGDRNCHAVGS
jgi:acetyl-CoA acetyltransferase